MSEFTAENFKAALFDFLNRKYIQQADIRQRAQGLQYMTAETHDLAKEITRFIKDYADEVIAQ